MIYRILQSENPNTKIIRANEHETIEGSKHLVEIVRGVLTVKRPKKTMTVDFLPLQANAALISGKRNL